MKIINNTNQVITLLNGLILKPFGSVITASSENLQVQIKNLVSLGVVRVS